MSAGGLALGAVLVGGALGGVLRFVASAAIARRFGEAFPWGTLFVNVTGALAVGVLAGLVGEGRHGAVWLGLAVGVLGSYTTVSSFSLQTLGLSRAGEPGRAALNVVANVVICLGAVVAGLALARLAGG